MKKLTTTIMSANGAAPYQPRATPWVRTHYATSPERASHRANQGGKPQQSRLIVLHQGKPEISHRTRPSRPGTPPSASIRVYLRSNSPFALLASFAVTPPGGRPPEPLRLCVKTPAIVPHQASSSLIKASHEKANYHHNERQRRGPIPAQGNALGSHPLCHQP